MAVFGLLKGLASGEPVVKGSIELAKCFLCDICCTKEPGQPHH